MPANHPSGVSQKTDLTPIVSFLNAYHPVGSETLKYLKRKLQEFHLTKGELLQVSGNPCPYLYFVVKGILRGYIIDNKKQVTTWITSENELISSIRGFLLRLDTHENVEALEDCHLVALHRDDLEYIYERYPEFNIVGRKILEYYYSFAEDRAFICRLSKASARYDYFMKSNGHLVNRIPLMYIASYLGMTIETLSRIRSGLTKSKSKV